MITNSTIYNLLIQIKGQLMADFSKLNQAVADLQTTVNSAVQDLQALTVDITNLKNSVDPTVQPQIDTLVSTLTGVTSNLSSAVSANPA